MERRPESHITGTAPAPQALRLTLVVRTSRGGGSTCTVEDALWNGSQIVEEIAEQRGPREPGWRYWPPGPVTVLLRRVDS